MKEANSIIERKIKVPANKLHIKKDFILDFLKKKYNNKCIDIGYIKNIIKINNINNYGYINYEVYDGSVFFIVKFSILYYPLLNINDEFQLSINSISNVNFFGINGVYECVVINIENINKHNVGDFIKVKVIKSFVLGGDNTIKVICELI